MKFQVRSLLRGESREVPSEYVDFLAMRAMAWTWDEWNAAPMYVRQYVADFVLMEGVTRGR